MKHNDNPAKSYKASIVIPVFNNVDYTVKCLESIVANTPEDIYEVIIIDNASTDGTAELLSALGGDVKIIRNAENIGFAKASNQGALAADGGIIVFLNNDTEVLKGWIAPLIDELENNPSTAMVGAKLLYPDGTIQHAGVAIGSNNIPYHIFANAKADDPRVMERRDDFPVVTAACAAVRKDEFIAIGLFDEGYVNGWEDIDLCIRYRMQGRRIAYRPDSVTIHHESKTEGRLLKSFANRDRAFSKWRPLFMQDDFHFQTPPSEMATAERQLRFAIKIGTPDRSQTSWGDIPYAEGLAKSLARLGHRCQIHYLNEWGRNDLDIDVVIHIKGLSRYYMKPYNINIMWMINHPTLHKQDELQSYDALMVASIAHAKQLNAELGIPVFYIPQATDTDHFKPLSLQKKFDIVFVGNNKGVDRLNMRKIVADVLPTKHSLAVWGDGWFEKLPEGVWKGAFIPHKDLPALYNSARIILNDHQPEMIEYGFVNNRTFDALACGVPVISDQVKGLSDTIGVYQYQNSKHLKKLIYEILAGTKGRTSEMAKLRQTVVAAFSFNKRAQEIADIVQQAAPEKLANITALSDEARSVIEKRRPLVSVLMGTHNRRRFLPAAIESIRAQSYTNWELILANDGGEQVDDIIASFGDDRIRLINLPKRGKGSAINAAFEVSRGEFIAHLDDDDIWYADHIERLLLPLLTLSDIKMAYTDAFNVALVEDPETGEFAETSRKLQYFRQITPDGLIRQNHIQGISVMHTRELFKLAGGMDEGLKVLIDWDLWRRLAQFSYPYHASYVTAEHYLRDVSDTTGKGQITSLYVTDKVRYMANRLRVLKKPLSFVNTPKLESVVSEGCDEALALLHIERGKRFKSNGFAQRAVDSYAKAYAKAPHMIHILRELAMLALELNDHLMFYELIRKCVERRTSSINDYLYYIAACITLSKREEALSAIESTSILYPKMGIQTKTMLEGYLQKALALSQ